MNHSIETLRKKVDQKLSLQTYIQKEVDDNEKALKECSRNKRNIDEALLIIQEVAKQTQQELEYHISDIVSTALASVFDDPYEFKVEFVIRRGKTEADLYFIKDKERLDPMSASGGGAVDIASFALRIALWNLVKDKVSNTIVLDEPFKWLSRDLQPKAGEMLAMLSKKLGIQFLIVTHNQDIIESADKVFNVEIKNGRSVVI
jgi:DNA repair exonuclease SbcCD ATPase subunit